jgi:integrase/recombinase XerD
VSFFPIQENVSGCPAFLAKEEVARLINASGNLFRRTLLMVLYGTGMRRTDVARLKIGDINSQRMIIRVVEGQGRQGSGSASEPGAAGDAACLLALAQAEGVPVSLTHPSTD